MRLILRAALLAAAVLTCVPASAQMPALCGNPVDIAQRLASEYGETVTARGIAASGSLVTVYSNAATQTWTVLVARPGGPACVVATGEGWEQIEYTAPADPS